MLSFLASLSQSVTTWTLSGPSPTHRQRLLPRCCCYGPPPPPPLIFFPFNVSTPPVTGSASLPSLLLSHSIPSMTMMLPPPPRSPILAAAAALAALATRSNTSQISLGGLLSCHHQSSPSLLSCCLLHFARIAWLFDIIATKRRASMGSGRQSGTRVLCVMFFC